MAALIVLIAGSYIPVTYINGIMAISFLVCVLLMLFVKEDYKRLKIDALGVQNSA